MSLTNPLTIYKTLCLGSLERANGSYILSYYTSPWKCNVSSPGFSWGSWNNISHPLFLIFFWLCFLFAFPLPCVRQHELATTRQPQPWWRPRMPCGMLEAATTLRSRPPRLSKVGALLPTVGGEATTGPVTPAPKVPPPPARISIPLRTLAMACANFKITTPIGLRVLGTLFDPCRLAYLAYTSNDWASPP